MSIFDRLQKPAADRRGQVVSVESVPAGGHSSEKIKNLWA